MKVRVISSSCNNAMELVNLRANDAECSRALLLTPGFSRVQKAKRTKAVSTAFLARQKLLKQFRCQWLRALRLKPGVNKRSRLMFKNVCPPARTLPDSLPTRLMKTPSLLGLTV